MATPLQPIKASLIADLVDLINENLGALLRVRTITCPACNGRGTIGGESRWNGQANEVVDDGTLATCATCGGVGAIEHYELDHDKLTTARFGRHIEQFEFKNGQYIPKFRSKDKAFAMLVKLLGFDKAVLEVAAAASITETLSDEQRAQFVEQLKEMAAMGLLDTAGSSA